MSQGTLEKIPEMPVGLCELMVAANIAYKIKGETCLSWGAVFSPLLLAIMVYSATMIFVWIVSKRILKIEMDSADTQKET